MSHKIYTERVNGGVIAECRDDNCKYPGKYKYLSKGIEKFDHVFPNRDLAVKDFKEFHKDQTHWFYREL